MQTKTKPTKPPVVSKLDYKQPTPIKQPYPLHQAPKPGQQATAAHDLSEAEYAAFGRSFLAADFDERQALQRVQQARQRKNQLIAEMNVKGNSDPAVEVCALCNLPHMGEC